jgi:hypothetical protein
MMKSVKIAIASLAMTGAALAAPARPTAGAVSPDRLKEPSGPSSVRGLADEPSVDAFHGEVEYQVPIAAGRLVAIGGGEYRVEGIGQTVRVKSVDGGFEVDDGAGVKYRLGTSPASRLGDGTHTQAWLIERETNLMGEQIDYAYTRDQGQLYPDSIVWGPRATYRVDFAYDARTDATISYRTGFSVVTAQRLSSIVTSVGGVERRAYELSYAR